MIPLTLRITNFRSIKETQAFYFADQPGLYFMQGINEVEPRLGSNGAGKSTAWDALTWCWFGKTPRGLSAGDVCNWEAGKGTIVEFDYAYDSQSDVVWTLRRTWGPNSWTLSHIAEQITDEEVIDLTKAESNLALANLRLEFEPFIHSIIIPQRRSMFLDLKKEAQAALFSDVLGLDVWLEYSARASKRASAQDEITRGLERELSSLQGQLDAIGGSKQYAAQSERWEAERAATVKDIEDEYEQLIARGKRLKESQASAQADAEKARERVRSLSDQEELAGDPDKRLREIELDLERQRVGQKALIAHIEHLEENAACPTCHQSLAPDLRKSELRKAESTLASIDPLIKRIEQNLEELIKECDQLERLERDLKNARFTLDDCNRVVSAAQRDIGLNNLNLDRLEEKVERILAEANPYAGLEAARQEKEDRLREKLQATQERFDESHGKYVLFSYWVRGFKELRLTQIAEALNELEIEANNELAALGLIDWELSFQVDRETKSGSIQRGFNAFVKSPQNSRPVPWEAWSGGEGQRLRIAAEMGLANLTRSRMGADLALEVWDEPTSGLSPEGIKDFLQALAVRARVEERQIWLVDHKAHDFGGFAGSAILRKTKAGSVIEQH